MSTISNAVLLIVNTSSYGLPFRPVGVYITTLEPNLAYFSANVKVISSANRTFSPNNVPNSLPLPYAFSNTTILKFITRETTLVPNLAYFSANVKVIFGATTFSTNNVPNASPVRYALANTNTFKFITRETTLVPNLAYFSANVKVISVTTTPAFAGPNPAINYAEDQVAYPYVRYPAFLYNIKATEQTLNNATMNLRTIYTTTTPAYAGPRPNLNYSQTQTNYPFIRYPTYLYNIKATEQTLNNATMNLRTIYTTSTFSPNNVPNASPVRYSLANDNILRFVTRITTLTPNLAFFSANMRSVFVTTTFSPNNVPNASPVRYSLANDNIVKFITRSTTIVPNLAYFSSNTKVFSVLALNNANNPGRYFLYSNVVYQTNSYTYNTRTMASTEWYQVSYPRQFWSQ